MNYHLTLKSENRKTGPIPTTVSAESTCPTSCPFKTNGCYAESGPMALHWRAVSEGRRGIAYDELLEKIEALPPGQLWRHNVAGDLAGTGNRIDPAKLRDLADANIGKRGFTYTHKPMTKANVKAVRAANRAGFTINLSANSPADADRLARHRLPLVAVVESGITANLTTPAGRRIVICPATTHDNVSCMTCGLCARADRDVIVGFPAHGSARRRIDIMLRQVAA